VTPLLGSAPAMARTAGDAGWLVRDVAERPVNVGVRTAADLVDYRFGQAQYAGWLAGLAAPAAARCGMLQSTRLPPSWSRTSRSLCS